MEKDSIICKRAGADIIFYPEVEEMYSGVSDTSVMVKNLTEGLCGKSRPGHFDGVCTVVSKLLNIVNPDRAYFGEKDFQQLTAIKKMVRDLNFNLEIVPCPIVREEDGLAMSSRNYYLSAEERSAALVLNQSLKKVLEKMKDGEKEVIKIKEFLAHEINKTELARIDYVEIVDADTLKEILRIEGPVLIALAVYFGKTRLIDNLYF